MMFSLHVFISFPPPGILEVLFFTKGNVFLHSFQICEQVLVFNFEVRRYCREEIRYFVSSTCFHQIVSPVMNLHIIFSPKVVFINHESQIDVPPLIKGPSSKQI